ncbi:MAG: ankyrin repeat domain-containing protein [Verrucomicrobiota bacterium]|nr:ankyrin repeat domain-containing protein [Verrucomicrobiota bacterium]|tara:strand:+ start:148 stop:630 length:483 start_codon:yes stop_codon:yes gene_type:complete
MKHLLLTTIAAVVLVGCCTEPVPPATKPPDISIHDAVIGGNIEAIKRRLDADTDVNEKNEKGWAPVHLMAVAGNKEIAELLIAKGANLNAITDFGWTPLHLADTKEIAELLISKGVNVNTKNDAGETPLDWAIKRKHTQTAKLLRKHGGKTSEELKAEGK